METGDALKSVASEAVRFFEFVAESLEDEALTDALVRDLGGDPGKIVERGGTPYPPGAMDSIRAYRDSADTKTEVRYQIVTDVAALVQSVCSVFETWRAKGVFSTQSADGIAHAALDLLATNYWRLKHPRTFLLFQALALMEDIGSTYGDASNSLYRIGDAFKNLGLFLWEPAKALGKLDPDPQMSANPAALTGDLLFRLAGGALAFMDRDADHRVPLLTEVYSGWDAKKMDIGGSAAVSKADLISERMSTFRFGEKTNIHGAAHGGELLVTIAMIPKGQGGTSLFVGLGGSLQVAAPSGDWTTTLKVESDGAVGFKLGHGSKVEVDGDSFKLSGSVASRAPHPTPEDHTRNAVFLSFPSKQGTRLDLGQIALSIDADKDGVAILLSLHDAALVVEASDHDGLISRLLKDVHLRLPFDLVMGHSTSGFVHEISLSKPEAPPTLAPNAMARVAQAPAVVDFALPVSKRIGPVTVHEVGLRILRGPAGVEPDKQSQLAIEVDASFSTQIGPLFLRIEQLGLTAATDSAAPDPNLGLIDLHLGLKAPAGIALNLETAFISGGGSITHDPAKQLYFGILDLSVRGGLMIKAVALINTSPDGYSLFLMATVEFGRPYPLGMGFFLEGVGGLFGFHRTFSESAMRAALPTGQLRNALFPVDPIRHAGEVQKALETLFPVQQGSHLIGVLVKVGWSSPALIHMELGVIYEWGRQNRLILLGRVSALLPRPDEALLSLNMDSVGILDFDAGTFALDAVLYDSKLCDRFVLSGAMAMRMGLKGSVGFALAIGGLHPRFNAPAGFPSVARLQLALTAGDNPKLICQSYFAVTSNTVQFGSDAALYASAAGFSIEGHIGFDVLIQLIPFHFLAEFRASVQLKRGSHNLFKVSVSGELEGPLPLRIAGKATFEILWCDFSVSFNRNLVGGSPKESAITVDALDLLSTALAAPTAWEATPPAEIGQMANTRPDAGEGVLLHPLGTLSVKQTVVPLALTSDIDRVGQARPSGERRFAITHAALGARTVELNDASRIEELFASGQYFDKTDDELLASPSFEPMTAGVRMSSDGYAANLTKSCQSAFEYLDIVINDDGVATELAKPHVPEPIEIWLMTMVSASARSLARRGATRRFEAPMLTNAPKVNRAALAPRDDALPPAPPTPPLPPGSAAPAPQPPPDPQAHLTWAEAQALAKMRGRPTFAPRWELAS